MLTRLLILPITLTFLLAYCVDKTIIDKSHQPKTIEPKSQLEQNSNTEPNKTNTNKIILSNGTKRFTLNDTIEEIESKSGVRLDLRQSTDDCYTDSSDSDLQLLFLRDTLISIDFFDSSYQTSKGFKVDDKISKLLNAHPEASYHESTSNMGDESYYVTTKSYSTQPDKQGNALTFHVSDNVPDTISIITVTNYLEDHSPCNAY